MPSKGQSVAGTTVAFSAKLPATYDQAGFEAAAVVFSEGNCEITNVGDIGRVFSEVNFTTVCARQEQSKKGSFKWSEFVLEFNRVFSDTAQMVLEDAEDSDDAISVRVTLQDGTKLYFTALVMGMPLSMGEANSMVSASVKLQITSAKLVRVDP